MKSFLVAATAGVVVFVVMVISMDVAVPDDPRPSAVAPPSPTPEPIAADVQPAGVAAAPLEGWQAHAMEHRGQIGAVVEYRCPPGGSLAPVWGTGAYTDDSSVCSAAVHRGVIERNRGGRVVIVIQAGRDSYDGTTRHGVSSLAWDAWDGSFIVMVARRGP
jgi:LCCL domain